MRNSPRLRVARPRFMSATASKFSLSAPTFDHENALIARNYRRICGVDEAGRGPLAGPVVAGAALLPRDVAGDVAGDFAHDFVGQLNDSKQLKAADRERLAAQIQRHAQWGIGMCDAREIDELNIRVASWLAMRRAIEDLEARFGAVDFVLADGLAVREIAWPWTYEALVKGDARSFSIAAASILAKVARDEMMREFDAQFPGYDFARHKGYPTRAHLAALGELGSCKIHRQTFAPVRAALRQKSALSDAKTC